MSRFQDVAVDDGRGPHVTMVAGVEVGGCFIATTSRSAAKVAAIRRRGWAAILRADTPGDGAGGDGSDGDGAGDDDTGAWTLLAGRATVFDPRRPLDVLADPVAAALAGPALARIGLGNVDQLLGYARDAGALPSGWQPGGRVLLAVHAEHRLRWRDGEIEASGAFAATGALPRTSRRRTAGIDGAVKGLTAAHAELVITPGPCAVGLCSPLGPVVVPGRWEPAAGVVRLDRRLLRSLAIALPGPCSITLDRSSAARPSAKVGVMLRGAAHRVRDRSGAGRRSGDGTVPIALRPGRVTAWDGFTSTSRDVDATAGPPARSGVSIAPATGSRDQ